MKLTDTFAVIGPDHGVGAMAVTPRIYEELDARFGGFRGHMLVAMHRFDGDWPTWERHPAGDEIVVLIDGEATLTLRTPDGDEAVTLAEAGAFAVVPRDTWHTARIPEAATLLFITPGEGTENVEAPPGA